MREALAFLLFCFVITAMWGGITLTINDKNYYFKVDFGKKD